MLPCQHLLCAGLVSYFLSVTLVARLFSEQSDKLLDSSLLYYLLDVTSYVSFKVSPKNKWKERCKKTNLEKI